MTGKQLRRLLPPDVLFQLERAKVPWSIEHCRRHFRLRIAGRVTAILSLSGTKEHVGAYDNLRSSVRRMLRGMGDGLEA